MAAVIATVVIAIIMAAIVIVAAILMVARLRGRRGRGHHCRRPHRDGGTGKRHDLELLQHCWSPCFRSEEHTSELQSLMRISYAVFCLKKKNTINKTKNYKRH